MKVINTFLIHDAVMRTGLFFCLVAAGAIPVVACSDTVSQEAEMVSPEHKEVPFEKVVREYVYVKKGWPDTAYTVEFKYRKNDILVYWVIHQDDGLSDEAGGGKSIEVHVNAESLEVQRELRFQ